MTLGELQAAVSNVWTDATYTVEFRNRISSHKHFEHALLHVMKAAGKLAGLIEIDDHLCGSYVVKDLEKYLADLVICAARMASMAPNVKVDLEVALRERLAQVKAKG